MENLAYTLQEFSNKKTKLEKLIQSWNLPVSFSEQDLSNLAEKILNRLSANHQNTGIRNLLEGELCVQYGLFKTDIDLERFTAEIMECWNN